MKECQPSPKKRKAENKASEVEEKKQKRLEVLEKKQKRDSLFKTAPTKPPASLLAMYARQVKDSGVTKTVEEVRDEFNHMTDDDKRNLKVEFKRTSIDYYSKMNEFLSSLTVEDRAVFESKHGKKLKPKNGKIPELTLDDLFPNRPKPPPTTYFFFQQYRADEIKAKMEG